MRPSSRLGRVSPRPHGVRHLTRWLVAAGSAAVLLAGAAPGALADDEVPSELEVAGARAAAESAARDVASVQADLAVANDELRRSAESAAQAAEAFNGARWQAELALREVRAAEQRAGVAAADVRRQQAAYADALTTTYQLSPKLQALSAMVQADGIQSVIDQTYTLANAESAMSGQYDAYRAASTLADVAATQAEQARAAATAAERAARVARNRARAAEAAALAAAQDIAERKTALLAELARLQDISVAVATQRQTALEQAAAEAAALAAAQEQQAPTLDPAGGVAASGGAPADPDPDPVPVPAPTPDPEPGPEPEPDPQPDPQPDPDPAPEPDPSPPPPATGAGAAIAFARAQLGEPYRWGAAGPQAWDCSGLTMGAWGAGGRSLPHYSVAQYQQSTAIAASALRPGDLVFWGSSKSPTSIFHVALYIGDGQIIHAPRTGRPVSQESMYYWTPPTFFARP